MSTYPRTRGVELDDATAGQPTDAERHVEREGAGRNRLDVHVQVLAHAHDRALAELLLDLAECGVEAFSRSSVAMLSPCFSSSEERYEPLVTSVGLHP